MEIREAKKEDRNQVWEIIQSVISTGNTYVFNPDSSKEEMIQYWFKPGTLTYVAVEEDEIIGTFIVTEHHPGLGSHIANASYMVKPEHRGKGIGRKLGVFSISLARDVGFLSLQFNLVVKTNTNAVKLWKEIGFEIIGEIPNAFDHQEFSVTNAYIMSRKL